ncbi:hypothetical protein J3R30DRAFT_3881538 [Lentinula aciculospora]|uniref:P-loop containing nucleoside triphosphate hydrolase protein n=1 Tax=Lentinula aciculospora TaxID=153920 RepID=A0A9W9ABT4_9AGAR|nr:hypothetical protein J3R30DRAFT_3881538 [Lentinula aciculospora]
MSDTHCTRIFLFSHLRTRSNLFMRLLETHPRVTDRVYPFKDAFMNGPECQNALSTKKGRARAVGKSMEEFEETFANTTFQAGLDAMEKTIIQAESEGKIAVIKEHTCFMLDSKTLNRNVCCHREEKPRPVIVDHQLDTQTRKDKENGVPHVNCTEIPLPNPTLLPSRLITTLQPVIIIRHPSYTFPSALRASSSYGANVFDPDFAIIATFRWQRLVFDFYREYCEREHKIYSGRGYWPIVVDGDKLINNTKDQMSKICEMVGLEEAGIRYTWDPHYVKRNAVWDAFTKVAEESTGVIKSSESIRPPNMVEARKKWENEWDKDVAQKLVEFVELAMDDYNYLLRHSI